MRSHESLLSGIRRHATRSVVAVSLLATGIVVGVAGVASATATQLVVQTSPAPSTSVQSGATLATPPTILVENNGTPVSDSTSITVTVNSASVSLIGTTTQVSTTTSGATFTGLGLSGPVGTYTLTFAATSLASATLSVTITPGVASKLAITTQPSPGEVSGVALVRQPVVAVEDSAGNIVTSVSSGSATATPTAGCTVTAGSPSGTFVNGAATFSGLTMTGASNTSCTLTFSNGTFTSAASSTVLMSTAAYKLVVTTQPATSATSGTALIPQPAVTVEDASGTPVLSDSSTVTATLTAPPAGSSLSNATTAAVNGVATFSGLAINALAGAYTLTFSDGSLITTVSNSITLSPGGAYKLAIYRQPSTSAVNGQPLVTQPIIQVLDSGGNVVTGNSSTVTATFTSGGVSLAGATATVNSGTGLATFSGLTLVALANNYTLTFSDGALTPVTSVAISLTAGVATQLVITTQPSSSVATGVAFAVQPVVKIEDSGGNVVSSNYSTVTASLATGTGTLAHNSASAVAGVAAFSGLTLTAAVGPYYLTFSDPGLTSTTSTLVSVTSGPATKLVITGLPSSTAQSGVPLAVQPMVSVEDAAGNVVTSDTSTVTARITSGGVSVSNASRIVSGGVAAYSGLAINALAGTYTLTFTDGALTAAVTGYITVSTGPATQLVVTQAPSSVAQSGVALTVQPVVKVEDSGGNVVTSVNSGQAIAMVTVGSGGSVTAGSTANFSYGVAAFSGLAITGVQGAQYQLTFLGNGFSVLDATHITIGLIQPPLVIKAVKGWLGRTLALVTVGGAGTGAVTYAVVSPGTATCSISGAVLSYKSLGTCVIVAVKAASGGYQAASSAPTTITIALLPTPPVLTLGFGPVAFHVNAGQARAIAVLANRLTTRSVVRIVAYAPGNIPLARARGLAVERFLTSRIHVRVQLILSTHTAARMVRVITLSQ